MITLTAACMSFLVLSGCGVWWQIDDPVRTIASHPCWSPDGAAVLYTSYDSARAAICSVDTTGLANCVLRDQSFDPQGPSVSPDGKWLAFWSGRRIYEGEIGLGGRVDPATVMPLTDSCESYSPKWSGGGLIAYHSSFGADTSGYFGICIMRADGTAKRRIPGSGGGGSPTWSPDCSRIAYVGCPEPGMPEVMVCDTAGTAHQRITRDTLDSRDPAWSPTGHLIAYTSWEHERQSTGVKPYIWLCDPTGALQSKLAAGSEPAWSPDGRRIALVDRALDGNYLTIFVIDTETKNKKQLVFAEERT
jgi:Tol biopolymer transport system component